MAKRYLWPHLSHILRKDFREAYDDVHALHHTPHLSSQRSLLSKFVDVGSAKHKGESFGVPRAASPTTPTAALVTLASLSHPRHHRHWCWEGRGRRAGGGWSLRCCICRHVIIAVALVAREEFWKHNFPSTKRVQKQTQLNLLTFRPFILGIVVASLLIFARRRIAAIYHLDLVRSVVPTENCLGRDQACSHTKN